MTVPSGNDTSYEGQSTLTFPNDPQLPISMYASEIVKLYIGPSRHLLNAHKSVLTKIEYFAKCLSDGHFVEGNSNKVELPEDRLDVWEEILYYLYAGFLKETSHDGWCTPGDYYLETWILADKYCIEDMCNAITDRLVSCTFEGQAKIKDIIYLSDNGLGNSMLAKLLVGRLAADLRMTGWEDYVSNYDDGLLEKLKEHPAWALELLQTIAKPKDRISPWDGVNRLGPCAYHVHIKSVRKPGCQGWHDSASEAEEEGGVQHGG